MTTGRCKEPIVKRLICLTAALILALGAQTCRAQSDGAGEPDSLDKRLTDSLGADLLEGLDDLPLDSAADGAPAKPSDAKLLEQLGEGEDLGAESVDPLERIRRQMKAVQERIAQQETSASTQSLQERIVADLDELLKTTKSKCNNPGQGSSSGAPKPSGGQPPQPGQQPARDSTQRLGEQTVSAADAEAMEALVKRVWGHLPDRARQELQNASVEEFLPKYQQVIEEYFRRLAEQAP